MEKETRMSKYKDLRDEMKEEVAISPQEFSNEEEDEDDFLSFMKEDEKKTFNDTLEEPLSYETLSIDSEEIKSALNDAKVKVGKEKYNTRLDILNKIKKDENTEEEVEEPQNKMTLLERLAAMSPEEDAEELKKYEEGVTIGDFMKEKESKKTQQKEETKAYNLGDFEEFNTYEEEPQDEEGESKLIRFLNYVIIFCILVFIVLAIFIVRQYFFS
ncbi:MAG: hypothetical protein LUG12_07065 [Erysipelotrichaceae bacterium]|nr:hypothetical protein [Erysipelotrichaceae bacterium]